MSIWDYIKAYQYVDFESFCNLIDNNCDITYVFNGKIGHYNSHNFIELLKKDHFENTIKSDVCKISIEKINTSIHISKNALVYNISEDSTYQKLGRGVDEDGQGNYRVYSESVITFLDSKIIQIICSIIKTKISINVPIDLIAIGGAKAVIQSENNSIGLNGGHSNPSN